MPHIIISVQIRTETGPTLCGDAFQDPELMKSIGAELKEEFGASFKHYMCLDPPRIVLDKLEKLGFVVIAMTGCSQTIAWTLKGPLN